MIWILWHRRIGDLNQMQDLANALGLPFVVKKLQFRKPHYAPLARLSEGADRLDGPWPELILCAEALTSVIARKLKKQAAGKIKIVSLARPSGDVRNFDLVLTTAQYRLPKLPHVVELMLPLTAAPPQAPKEKSNTLTVLIGASSPPEVLDADVAGKMAADILAYATDKKLILNVVTSPRTSPAVAQIFVDAIAAPHPVFIWTADSENLYQKCLADAAEIIVTSDSVSMLADGLAARKPVQVYRLPRRFTALQNVVEWVFERWPTNFIFRSGIVEPATDRWLLVDRLVAKKYVCWFGEDQKPIHVFDPLQDIDAAVTAIQELISPSRLANARTSG